MAIKRLNKQVPVEFLSTGFFMVIVCLVGKVTFVIIYDSIN